MLGKRARVGPRSAAGGVALIIAILVTAAALLAAPATAADNPLRPPDTSSPRDTMRSFIDGTYGAYRTYLGEPQRTRAGLRAIPDLRRAVRTLDLSEVPPALVDDVGLESTLLLKEVLDRIELPPTSSIPGDDEASPPKKWTVPGTEITIAAVETGPRAGEYLFTPETVRRAHEFYERAKHLPYQPGASEGFYALAVFAPGWMIPYQWVQALPAWLKQGYFEQALWQWLALGLVALVSAALMASALVWQRRRVRNHPSPGWSRLLFPAAGMLVAKAAGYLIEAQINITGSVLNSIKIALDLLFFVFVAFLLVALSSIAVQVIIASHRFRPRSIDTHLVRVSLRIVMIALIAVVVLHVTASIGIPLTPVLAGLGVGGLAVALAAQSTIENVIGGLTLFGDRPVRVGQFCRFGDTLGTVEEIGLRSTRIRTLERTLVTVPNAEFSKLQLENFNSRDRMLLHTTIGLRYETTAEQLRLVLARLRELLRAHPKVSGGPQWVRFAGFGAYSLDVEIFAYVGTGDWVEFLGVREDLYLRIMNLIDETGTAFAFPSQTHYLAQDQTPNRAAAATTEMPGWRAHGVPPPDPRLQGPPPAAATVEKAIPSHGGGADAGAATVVER